jgi:hypothetical protein
LTRPTFWPVIPAKAGIQRLKKSLALARQNQCSVRFAAFFLLDSGFRRNDAAVKTSQP